MSLGQIVAIVATIATLVLTWHYTTVQKKVWISVDSYSTQGAELEISTTTFNELDHNITLQASVEAVTVTQNRMGVHITSISQKQISLTVDARSIRKDRLFLPSPKGMGSINIHITIRKVMSD